MPSKIEPTCDNCGRALLVATGTPDFEGDKRGVTMSYQECECGVVWSEGPPLSDERKEEIVSKLKAVKPDVCSNCREALCGGPCYDEGGDSEKPCHCAEHYIVLPHHIDGSPAHGACTGMKLVTVRGCVGCRLRFFNWCNGNWEPRLLPDDYVNRGFDPECPLLKDGKSTAGVRIVAIKEDEG